MDINSKTIKIKETKTEDSLESARYYLSYKQSNKVEEARTFSYKLLSLLKGSSDVVMEINTSLFFSSGTNSDFIQFYIEYAKKLGLDYRYRKIQASGNKSIFSRLLSQGKNQDAHELIIHVPAGIWEMEGFCDYINTNGTRYYFTGAEKASGNLLDEMGRMTDTDKLNFFKLIVFDFCSLGNMGINSKILKLDDLKKLLNLT